MKHYTTIEQSKKLLELGLNPKSADMYYLSQGMDDSGKKYYSLDVDEGYNDDISERDIPCWSLAALLQVMPIVDEHTYHICGTLNGGALCEHGCTSVMFQEDTIIDACFEMVCWLLENGYIKKGE